MTLKVEDILGLERLQFLQRFMTAWTGKAVRLLEEGVEGVDDIARGAGLLSGAPPAVTLRNDL